MPENLTQNTKPVGGLFSLLFQGFSAVSGWVGHCCSFPDWCHKLSARLRR